MIKKGGAIREHSLEKMSLKLPSEKLDCWEAEQWGDKMPTPSHGKICILKQSLLSFVPLLLYTDPWEKRLGSPDGQW